jgi:Helix-turn-helix domain
MTRSRTRREPVEIDPLREEIREEMLAGLQNVAFKKIYADRDNTFRMPAGALKVWMYLFRCERDNRRAYPSLATICEKLNMNEATVLKWRKWLVKNGWLAILEKAYRKEDGKWVVPVFRVTRPDSSPKTLIALVRPFNTFVCHDKMDKVFLLPLAQFKIWLYRLRLERSRRRESWMSNSELAEKLDLDIKTVRLGQESLAENGWLLERGKRFIPATGQTLTIYSVRWDGEIPDVQDRRQGYGMAKARKLCGVKA